MPELTIARVAVPFVGPGAGVGPLTWGQRELWRAMQRQRDWLPLGGSNPLDPDTTVDDIAGVLSYLMSRYPSMRTRLQYADDGPPIQVVAAAGEIWLEIVEAGDSDPAEVTAEVEGRYRTTYLDYRQDWPVRMAVVRQHGVLTHQVTIIGHLALDAYGAAVMLADLVTRPAGPARGMPALEQARWQQSPAGIRTHDASMRHWEAALRRIPTPHPVRSGHRCTPRYWEGHVASRAMFLAVRAIVARTGVDSGHVLLALAAAAFGAYTGRSPVPLRLLVNNRFRRDLADVVAPVTQTGLCVIDVAGAPFDEVLERVRRSTMAAFKHAYLDPARLWELVDGVVAERGPVLDTACIFNDRRLTSRMVADTPVPTADEIRAALASTTVRWELGRDTPFETLFIHVEDVPDVLSLMLQVDTHLMGLAEMADCVRGMERIAVDAAGAEGELSVTTLEAIATYLPQPSRTIEDLAGELGLTPMQVRVFRRFYAYAHVRRDPDATLLDLLDGAVGNLAELRGQQHRVRYVLHARSFAVVTPYPVNPLHELCRRRGLAHATAFTVTHQACASALAALDIAGRLLAADPDPDALALILTGEKAFTDETRIVPETSVFGEGAAACLVGRDGPHDRVLSYATWQRGEFDDAADAADETFGAQYPTSLAAAITAALDRAGRSVDEVTRILPHNVNAVAWQRVCRQLRIGIDRVVLDTLPATGHVFCADAFLNHAYARAHGLLAPGDVYVIAAAGAARGATFAAMVLQHRPQERR